MDRPELPAFRDAIAETTALLKSLRNVIPARVDEKLVAYLELVQEDDVGLELLRNAIAPKQG